MLVSFVVVLGVLIVVHELGHFIMARLAGVGVERFSVGFGPVLWRFRGKETEYCVSAVPMGGYVKMMGDDENPLEGGTGAFDPAKAFYTKPLIVRFLIVFAGPAMNFVLAAAIFAIVFMTVGRPALPSIVGRVTEGGPASAAGLATRDRIAKVDGHPIRSWDELLDAVQDSKGAPLRLTVAGRAGDREVTVSPVRTKSRDILGDEKDAWDLGVHAYAPAVIGDTVAGSPAEKAGLQGGDTVTALDGQPIASWDEM